MNTSELLKKLDLYLRIALGALGAAMIVWGQCSCVNVEQAPLDSTGNMECFLGSTHSLPGGLTSEEQERNTKLLLEIQQNLLKKLDELVSKAGS
jgi:hypothetical protein